MNFKDFKKDVESAFNAMIADNLFVVNVDKDLLWMSYLLSFEDETIRQDHNCNACKSFIRHYGKVVAIDPQTYKVKTFWDDVHTPGYEKTASDLAKLVKEAGIGDIFIQDVNEFHGCDHNVQLLPDGTTRTWTHLYVTIPSNSELELKFNIVKDVITDKLKDKAAREAAKDKAAEKARLTELLAKKQSEKMESMSEDEIRQRLSELG